MSFVNIVELVTFWGRLCGAYSREFSLVLSPGKHKTIPKGRLFCWTKKKQF
jgi:hypothetical protein